jgi:hypothetical protein
MPTLTYAIKSEDGASGDKSSWSQREYPARHYWDAGRRVSCTGHLRPTSGFAIGPRRKIGTYWLFGFSRDPRVPMIISRNAVSICSRENQRR